MRIMYTCICVRAYATAVLIITCLYKVVIEESVFLLLKTSNNKGKQTLFIDLLHMLSICLFQNMCCLSTPKDFFVPTCLIPYFHVQPQMLIKYRSQALILSPLFVYTNLKGIMITPPNNLITPCWCCSELSKLFNKDINTVYQHFKIC